MTDEEFDALRERVKGHTPGPWQQQDGNEFCVCGTHPKTGLTDRIVHTFPVLPMRDCTPFEDWCAQSRRDAALIAAAPDLLAYAERLRAAVS